MKALILASVLALAACEQSTTTAEYYVLPQDTPVYSSLQQGKVCEEGIAMSEQYADLMERSLKVNASELYMRIEATKRELDILLQDACGVKPKKTEYISM